MKNAILMIVAVAATLACQAQGKYQISGKISGVADGSTLLLVRNDGEQPDTLATTTLNKGTFLLIGELDVPAAGGYLAASDGSLSIPLIVESTNIMVNASNRGILIQGGEQQKLFARYNQIGQAYAAAQAAIQQEAQQPDADMDALQARIDQAYQTSLQQTDELIKANPDAYATAYIIALGASSETEESLQAKYALLGESAKNSLPGKQILAAMDRFIALSIGREAPNFTTTTPEGNALTLFNLTSKYKLVAFWASWDAASRNAAPELIQIYRQFRPRGLEIVSISLDENPFAWTRAIEADGISIWYNGSDLRGVNSPIAKEYMVSTTLPYYFLIDAENRIVFKGTSTAELRQHIADLTKKKRK